MSARRLMSVWVVAAGCGLCAAQSVEPERGPTHRTAVRGLTSSIEITAPANGLIAKPGQSPVADPLVVRVLPRSPDGTQRIEFTGLAVGEYDLRDFVRHGDGGPVDDLPSMVVKIESRLPAGRSLSLDRAPTPATPVAPVRSRWVEITLATAWTAVPVMVLARRFMARAKPAPVAVLAMPPSEAEQLRRLVDHLRQRALTVEEQARLELLLLRFLSDRAGPASDRAPGTIVAEIRGLRDDPSAGPTVRAIERWLHARDVGSAEAAAALAHLGRCVGSDQPMAAGHAAGMTTVMGGAS